MPMNLKLIIFLQKRGKKTLSKLSENLFLLVEDEILLLSKIGTFTNH